MGKIVGISVQQIEDRLIDVRSPRECWECHAPMALNIPLETLHPHAITMALNVSEFMPIHIICGDGVLSLAACWKFSEIGFGNAIHVRGGMEAWEAEGLPVVRSSTNDDDDVSGRMAGAAIASLRLAKNARALEDVIQYPEECWLQTLRSSYKKRNGNPQGYDRKRVR